MLPRGPERGNDPLQGPSGGLRSHLYTAERTAWLIIFLKICLFLSKEEANKQRGACFWDANKDDFFFLIFFFFLICMLTFLLSINNCLTKSLAKDSQIDFQREFTIYHLKCFSQKTGVWGKKQKVVWMPYREDLSCGYWWSPSETTASNVWDIQLWVMVSGGGKGKAGGPSGFEFFCSWANDFPCFNLSIFHL